LELEDLLHGQPVVIQERHYHRHDDQEHPEAVQEQDLRDVRPESIEVSGLRQQNSKSEGPRIVRIPAVQVESVVLNRSTRSMNSLILVPSERYDGGFMFLARVSTLLMVPLLLACGTLKTERSTRERPNLIVILADDLGSEAFGCYGGESYRTPNVDRLAREGVRFRNAFTQPLCTPTRVELLTGRSNARNYRAFSVLDPAERTFAEVLRQHGYRTCAVGKWQLLAAEHYPKPVRGSGSAPEQAGFDRHALWQVEALGERHWAPTLTIDGRTRKHGEDEYGPDIALEFAKRWIDDGRDQPFVLFWPMILPHGPFIAPPATDGPRHPPGDVAQFGPMVEYVDTLVGALGDHLRARDLSRNTMVIFVGDNGSPRQARSVRRGVRVKGGKSQPTDRGSRVPFVVWAPGRVDGEQVIDDPVSTVDIFATLLDAADIDLPTDRPLDGWSFLPRILGSIVPHREWVTFHHHPRPVTRPNSKPQRWARDARWQLFEDGRLFDTEGDPELKRPRPRGAGASMNENAARARLEAALETLPSPEGGI